jgi:hypothetical protein
MAARTHVIRANRPVTISKAHYFQEIQPQRQSASAYIRLNLKFFRP